MAWMVLIVYLLQFYEGKCYTSYNIIVTGMTNFALALSSYVLVWEKCANLK